jgi:L-alanine-DL-glutamate epimerase-like enolase superfamily enzyme
MTSPKVQRLDTAAYKIPTEHEQSDGTLKWNSTTVIVVQLEADDQTGMGYTYSDVATAELIMDKLHDVVVGSDPMSLSNTFGQMQNVTRNLGQAGIVASAIAAVDVALWDLKARILKIALIDLMGAARTQIPIYGSGGFTSYSVDQLCQQLADWADKGVGHVKMKVGRHPHDDRARVEAARSAIGPHAELFVDANGAYDRKQALAQAESFARHGVTWFEEPVSSNDLAGLHFLRNRFPAGMQLAAGEYGYDLFYFHRMLRAQAVDVLMVDATRCGGFTGFMSAAALCLANSLPLSAHTAPNLHAHVCCAVQSACHAEYFHDHVRIEQMLFDGSLAPIDGCLCPHRSQPGMGLALKKKDAQKFLVWKGA